MFHSFIFQILSGIYSIHKLCNICHFDLHGGNILISNIEANGYWLYSINNSDYYIPNYGYILLVDSNFKDIDTDDVMKAINQDSKQQHKLISNMFEVNYDINNKSINKSNRFTC